MRILEIFAKVGDKGTYNLIDGGQELASYSGSVPSFISREHYGNYLNVEIDVDTGQIVNWNPDMDLLEQWAKENECSQ